jgi:hypothetical protein
MVSFNPQSLGKSCPEVVPIQAMYSEMSNICDDHSKKTSPLVPSSESASLAPSS